MNFGIEVESIFGVRTRVPNRSKSLLGAMLVQDDPKDHFGWILDLVFDRFRSILGSILQHSGIDVERTFATKLDRSFWVP